MGRGYTAAPLSCAAPQGLPGARVDVTLGDIGMSQMMGGTAPRGARMALIARPASVRAGQVSFVVANRGWRTHELVVLPWPREPPPASLSLTPPARLTRQETWERPRAPALTGSGEGIESGSVGWVTITLPSGRYELVCNLTNHYANGMRQELVVTA